MSTALSSVHRTDSHSSLIRSSCYSTFFHYIIARMLLIFEKVGRNLFYFQKTSMEDQNSKSTILKVTIGGHLECPVCLSVPNTGPVFQCDNGHLICCKCRPKLIACPVCRIRLGYSRNLTSEKLIALLSLNRNDGSNIHK